MSNERYAQGLVDTSVIIGLDQLDPLSLPVEFAVSAVTMAELAAGPCATSDPDEKARRQDRLQRAEAMFDAIPVDVNVSRAYGRVYAAVASLGRKPRGRRAFDMLIAATALSEELPLFTVNPDDFSGLTTLMTVVPVAWLPRASDS